jgi:hypothetical protein
MLTIQKYEKAELTHLVLLWINEWYELPWDTGVRWQG